MNILFVCTANKLRSPTAEAVFSERPDITVRSAGLDPEVPCRLDAELIAWADKIFAMETHHREKIRKKFRKVLGKTPVITLGIPSPSTRSPQILIRFSLKYQWSAFVER